MLLHPRNGFYMNVAQLGTLLLPSSIVCEGKNDGGIEFNQGT